MTQYDPQKHDRRSIRLRGHDYASPGAYFVTICTQDRQCLFGDVVGGDMQLNDGGRVAEECWWAIPKHFPHAALDAFVVMPNHVHGVIMMTDTVGAKNLSPLHDADAATFRSPSMTIGSIVRGFKVGVTKWFRKRTDIYSIWQRNYYEHIIRNEDELIQTRTYIAENPLKWELDENHPRYGVDQRRRGGSRTAPRTGGSRP